MQEILAAIQALRDDVARLNERLESVLNLLEPSDELSMMSGELCNNCGMYRSADQPICPACNVGRYPVHQHHIVGTAIKFEEITGSPDFVKALDGIADDPLTVG